MILDQKQETELRMDLQLPRKLKISEKIEKIVHRRQIFMIYRSGTYGGAILALGADCL